MANEAKLKFYKSEVMTAINQSASRKMSEAVNVIRNKVIDTLSGTRKYDSSRLRYVPGTRKRYQASSPGEPPAIATSDLFKSISTSVEKELGGVVGKVGTDQIQGKMMELGTRHVAPRPWLRISFEKVERKVMTILGGRWF